MMIQRGTPEILSPDEFITVVISSYCRPQYLVKCLESIHKYADYPFELIVHDDGSHGQFIGKVLEACRPQVSSLICNYGPNLGLNVSVNRMVSMAWSNYILFMNDDCTLLKPCFKAIRTALDMPYVSWIAPTDSGQVCLGKSVGDYKIGITKNLGGGHATAFKKEQWAAVGGWDEGNTSGHSDEVVMIRMIKSGQFKGLVEGGPYITAVHPNSPGYVACRDFTDGSDCNYPKIFGIPKGRLRELSHKRRETCQFWVDGERTIPGRPGYDGRENPVAGLIDMPYWGTYMHALFPNDWTIDWEVGKRHGHNKWQDQISAELKKLCA